MNDLDIAIIGMSCRFPGANSSVHTPLLTTWFSHADLIIKIASSEARH